MAVALSLAACAGSGDAGTDDLAEECALACEAMLGECDGTDPDARDQLDACADWCEEDGLTDAERGCMASVACGEAVVECFEGEGSIGAP